MNIDLSKYPTRWKDYIGQEPAKRVLQVASKSARIRKVALDHQLIAHPSPGVGKTALALLAAREMRTDFKMVSGKLSRDAARMKLSEMADRDVLFYDEIHQALEGGKAEAEKWMLSYLQDGIIFGPLGPERFPRVTIIAATTDPGKLPVSILGRFSMVPMEDYTNEEAAKIAAGMGVRILGSDLPRLRPAEAAALAGAAHNNPRAIERLLERLRDLVITDTMSLAKGRYDIAQLLEFQGITPDGLDRTAQQYLRALATEFGGSAGVKSLEDRLQQPGGLSATERTLMDKGLVAKTRTGRTLTQAGIVRFRELQEVS